ncbi:hypothetical protein ACQJBY_015494 [Aegilops geniculata]
MAYHCCSHFYVLIYPFLSSASKHILFAIGNSSHSISDVFFSRSAKCEPWLMSHVDSSVRISGMWNLECDVLPPSRSSAAIPYDAIDGADAMTTETRYSI